MTLAHPIGKMSYAEYVEHGALAMAVAT